MTNHARYVGLNEHIMEELFGLICTIVGAVLRVERGVLGSPYIIRLVKL